MKTLLLALALISPLAHALPVLNENAVTNGSLITLWPDHEDENVFYYSPSMYETMESGLDRVRESRFTEPKILMIHKPVYNPALE